jgi:outer membrane protein OmpA-like peptidoglycan-associated protein
MPPRIRQQPLVPRVPQLRRQIDVQQAKPTDRGLVLTLGDVLFTSGRADLKTASRQQNRRVEVVISNPVASLR